MGKKLRRPVIEAVLLAVVAGVILSAGWVLARTYDTQRAYTPTNLIRLHIIGNSDDLQDQEVKLKIRDVLLSTFGERLLNVTDRQEAEAILTVLLPEIEDTVPGIALLTRDFATVSVLKSPTGCSLTSTMKPPQVNRSSCLRAPIKPFKLY